MRRAPRVDPFAEAVVGLGRQTAFAESLVAPYRQILLKRGTTAIDPRTAAAEDVIRRASRLRCRVLPTHVPLGPRLHSRLSTWLEGGCKGTPLPSPYAGMRAAALGTHCIVVYDAKNDEALVWPVRIGKTASTTTVIFRETALYRAALGVLEGE